MRIAPIFLIVALVGCSSAARWLVHAAQGAQAINSILDTANTGARKWFARHPNQETEAGVDRALRATRSALRVFNAAVAATRDRRNMDIAIARERLLDAYGALWDLLDTIGILAGRPPNGGAESDAPLPRPVALPPVRVVAGWLGSEVGQ